MLIVSSDYSLVLTLTALTSFQINSCDGSTDLVSFSISLQTERPMKIEIVFDPAKQPLVNRVAAPAATSSTVAAAGGGGGAR